MGFILLVPFFLVRFTLMAALNREAIPRAAHFPPMRGAEKAAYWVYQLSTAVVILCILFAGIRTEPAGWFCLGLFLYLGGLALLAASMVDFASPSPDGINRKGLCRISRNPMYLAYFVLFLGCASLTRSLVLLGAIAVFQLSAHWIILAEERWCAECFGEAYLQYQKQVRRYL